MPDLQDTSGQQPLVEAVNAAQDCLTNAKKLRYLGRGSEVELALWQARTAIDAALAAHEREAWDATEAAE